MLGGQAALASVGTCLICYLFSLEWSEYQIKDSKRITMNVGIWFLSEEELCARKAHYVQNVNVCRQKVSVKHYSDKKQWNIITMLILKYFIFPLKDIFWCSFYFILSFQRKIILPVKLPQFTVPATLDTCVREQGELTDVVKCLSQVKSLSINIFVSIFQITLESCVSVVCVLFMYFSVIKC